MIKNRVEAVDIFRGWAIVLMIAYHIGYHLNLFGYIHFEPEGDILWIVTRHIIVTLFLLTMGMSLKLTHLNTIRWQKVRKRSIILGVASILVTLSTYISFPTAWVYFGILHFIFVSSLMGLLFLSYPRFSLFVAISIFVSSAFGWLGFHNLYLLLKDSLLLPNHPQDLVPFFPWFGVVLLGIVFVSYGLHNRLPKDGFLNPDSAVNRGISFMGRHSLLIYLVHLPTIFGIFLLIKAVTF